MVRTWMLTVCNQYGNLSLIEDFSLKLISPLISSLKVRKVTNRYRRGFSFNVLHQMHYTDRKFCFESLPSIASRVKAGIQSHTLTRACTNWNKSHLSSIGFSEKLCMKWVDVRADLGNLRIGRTKKTIRTGNSVPS